MADDRHPRLELHDAIASALTDPRISGPGLEHAIVTRWIVVGELALPDSNMAMLTLSGTGGGRVDLRTWEQTGLLGMALHRALSQGGP